MPSREEIERVPHLKQEVADLKARAESQPPIVDRMLKWFAYSHLPEHLRQVSAPFGELAARVVESIEPGPERTVALRKLLEAKDAAVRAKLTPGG